MGTGLSGACDRQGCAVDPHRRCAFHWRSDRRLRRRLRLAHRCAGTNQIMIDKVGMVDRSTALLPVRAA